MVSSKDLNFWIKNNYNILFIGEAGVGKTSMVLDAFSRHNLKWQYYSASTMDPWVDLIGVPKEVKDEKGEPVLDLIKPKQWQEDNVEAVFIDEFNRAPKKVRNAIMELIQFKSINGKRYDSLKIVWAAINPEDSDMENEYDVEQLDPAQKDRFHFHVKIPYKPSLSYFQSKYGKELANPAVEWWNKLPKEIKKEVSPRRLDYAIDIYSKGGKLDWALPKKSNISKLTTVLGQATYLSQLLDLETSGDSEALAEWLAKPNNYFNVDSYVWSTKQTRKTFAPLLPKERIATAFALNPEFKKEFSRTKNKVVIEAIGHVDEIRRQKKEMQKAKLEAKIKDNWERFNPTGFSKRPVINSNTYSVEINTLRSGACSTYDRRLAVRKLINICPDKNNLQPNVATAMLAGLLIFCKRSHPDTIKNETGLVACINHLIYYLYDRGEFELKMIPSNVKKKLYGFEGFILSK